MSSEERAALETADREGTAEIVSYNGKLEVLVNSPNRAKTRIPIYIDASNYYATDLLGRREHLGSTLCEFAAHNGCEFDFRYGAIWLVPVGKAASPFLDPTGVSEIHFPAGSDEDREWNAKVEINANGHAVRHFARDLFAGTYLRVVDISTSVDKYGDDLLARRWEPTKTLIGSRRNAFGILLYRGNYRCELRNGQLCIFPRSERTGEQQK